MSVSDVTDSSFKLEVLDSDKVILVDFWAPWCGPCKSIAPVLEELSGEYDGKVLFMKMNVDENTQTPAQYKVRGIPNLIIFKGGEVVEQLVGAVPKEQLKQAIDKAL